MCLECDELRVTRRSFLGSAGAAATAVIAVTGASAAQSEGGDSDPDLEDRELTLTSGGAAVPCYLTQPRSAGPHPAVVVAHGNPGLPLDIRFTARLLARSGIAALVFDPGAHAPPMPEDEAGKAALSDYVYSHEFVSQQLDDAQTAIDHLKTLPFVRDQKIGMVGFCGGGRLALLLAAGSPDVKAVVALHAAVRYQRRNSSDPVPDVIDEVSKIRVPVQGHYGVRDTVARVEDARDFERALREQGGTAEMFYYPDAGHSFCDFKRPPGSDPGFDYDPDACWLAHERMVTFLRQRLL